VDARIATYESVKIISHYDHEKIFPGRATVAGEIFPGHLYLIKKQKTRRVHHKLTGEGGSVDTRIATYESVTIISHYDLERKFSWASHRCGEKFAGFTGSSQGREGQ
jgi:hypothetical protein